MVSEPTVSLAAGNLRLTLSPSIGGSISGLEWHENGQATPVLRRCNSPPKSALEAASFPLVPYVNRIRGGEFTFRGWHVRLRPNMAGDPSPLHGQGWLHPWRVEDSGEDSATLVFTHPAGKWPWDYEARQDFALDSRGLSLRLSCRNSGNAAMPCGLGQHPYFHCGPETRIATAVTDVWTIDEHVLPVERVPAEGRYDLSDAPVCGRTLDHGFGGWSGSAKLSDPGWPFALRLSSPTARFFQLYSPPTGGIFVAEPVTHANAALNAPEEQWPELGMRVLEPGETLTLAMRLEVTAKSRGSG
jgi:aldose 1-epimerase